MAFTEQSIKQKHPAQLWIGNHSDLVGQAEQYLQSKYCLNKQCNVCSTCKKIRNRQFHLIKWIENLGTYYTQEDIEPIFEILSLMLDKEQEFFFIIQKADLLSVSCANKLLKSIEEPPLGYNFIFLSEQKNQILPTIKSRCLIKNFSFKVEHDEEVKLEKFFIGNQTNPIDFLKELDKERPSESETLKIIDKLIIKLALKLTKSKDNEKIIIDKKLNILKNALFKSPMPGSSKIFWKNVFLLFHSQNNKH